jgi:hypothetical protein
VALIVGGDGLNGKAEAGRCDALSLFVTHPLAFVAGWRAQVASSRERM